jgi:hypothetical protein
VLESMAGTIRNEKGDVAKTRHCSSRYHGPQTGRRASRTQLASRLSNRTWMIERSHLDLPSVRKAIRRVHLDRRTGWAVSEKQTGLFADSHEV